MAPKQQDPEPAAVETDDSQGPATVPPLPDETLNDRLELFNQLYEDCQTDLMKSKSVNERRDNSQEQVLSLTYGEVEMPILHQILNKVKTDIGTFYPSKGLFVDLGSGAGKVAVAAALLHPFEKVIGIETLQSLHEVADGALQKYQALELPADTDMVKPDIEFIKGDFAADLEAKLEPLASNIAICFAVSTCYEDEQMQAIGKLAELMAGESIFVTFTKRLPESLIIDLNRSPAQRNAIATRRALKRRGVEPEGIEIVPDPPANHPNGWFEVHSQEIDVMWGRTTYFIYKKIGSFFPFLQPENAKFEFNLADNEQRLCASMFTSLAAKEKLSNIRDPEMVQEDGTPEPLAQGVPASWENIDQMPQTGIFKGTYTCAKEDRNLEFRKKLFETYGATRGGNGAWKSTGPGVAVWEAIQVSEQPP